MSQPKTGKSFRAAGDRIVREEAQSPEGVTRLLGSTKFDGRDAANHDDAWDLRLGALAQLAQLDGLAVIPSDSHSPALTYNLPIGCAADDPIRAAIDDANERGTTAQVRAAVRLSDGRTATTVLVAPAVAGVAVTGVIVGARVGRSFGAIDAVSAAAVGTLLSLELVRAGADVAEARDRRDALLLYELARLATSARLSRESLQGAVKMLGERLGHDVVHLWTLRSGGSLELRAATPPGSVPLEIARPNDHSALADALRQPGVVRLNNAKPPFWVPGHVRHLLIVPLWVADDPLGLLVFGRVLEPYGVADDELSRVIGEFLAGVLSALRGGARPAYDPAVPATAAESWPEASAGRVR